MLSFGELKLFNTHDALGLQTVGRKYKGVVPERTPLVCYYRYV